jgi:AcrR family transcriptional regulator
MSPQPSDASSSRDRLLQAAKRLFAAHGYEQTATSAIAREAGTSESQLMRYFGGKVGLLQALFDAAWVDLNARARRAFERERASHESILTLLQIITSAFARDPDLATLFLFEARRVRSGKGVQLSKGFVTFTEMVKGVVRKGQQEREIDQTLDAAAVTASIFGAVEAMTRERLLARSSGGRAFADREVGRTVDAMLAGFAPGARRPRRSRPK